MKMIAAALLAVALLVGTVGHVYAGDTVRGYFRSNGTYVNSYHRSNPNGTVTDNYSFKGNISPYTGKEGSNYYRHSPSSPYYQGPSMNPNTYGHGPR
jgi:hypothetical protein